MGRPHNFVKIVGVELKSVRVHIHNSFNDVERSSQRKIFLPVDNMNLAAMAEFTPVF